MSQNQALGLKALDLGFRVWGLGFGVPAETCRGLMNRVFYDRHALPMLLLYMENKCASGVGAATSLDK